ncbi:MAG: cyclic nucleotide-binding domain-containing protein [Proteobacteria bacterium]|nr:cyclic nucleotide-binding domain-containing protein [Pseudomonadota bacterium]
MRPQVTRRVDCNNCPVGTVSGVGKGQFCPFIVRSYPRNAQLYRRGDAAGYIWFVKSGVVALDDDQGACEFKYPNSFIGAEVLETGIYRATARTLEPSTLCGATREGFSQWISRNSESLCTALCRAFESSQ